MASLVLIRDYGRAFCFATASFGLLARMALLVLIRGYGVTSFRYCFVLIIGIISLGVSRIRAKNYLSLLGNSA